MSACYKIDFKTRVIEIYNIKGVGKLITSLQLLIKDWKDYKIIIHNKHGSKSEV